MKEKGDTIVNPIYEWTDADVWNYIRQRHIKVNPLYERGYTRVGCIGCPLAPYNQRVKEFNDYPKYKNMYIQAFERMIKAREELGKTNDGNDYHSWKTGEDVMEWWLEMYKRIPKGQLNMFDNKDELLNALNNKEVYDDALEEF